MNEETIPQIVPDEVVMSKIHLIRGQKVMLDSDLAALYGIETKNLNKAVKRNLSRFPEDFMFRCSKEEYVALRFQNGTSKPGRMGMGSGTIYPICQTLSGKLTSSHYIELVVIEKQGKRNN